jgi:hypothetical protein
MIVAAPSLAKAQIVAYSTSAPVEITSFSIDERYAAGTIGGEAAAAPQFVAQLDSGYIELRFVNKSNVPATTVKFVVNKGQYRRSIVDEGSFTPGVQIKHTFAAVDVSELSNATCEIAEVDFADGSAWHAQGDAGSDAKRQAERERADADARRGLFRHQGTSL